MKTSSLNIFWGKKDGGEKRPGLMYQITIFNKVQQVASKNNDVDKDLSQTETIVLDSDRKVKITIKYVPTVLPAKPNPSYDVLTIDTKK